MKGLRILGQTLRAAIRPDTDVLKSHLSRGQFVRPACPTGLDRSIAVKYLQL